MGDGGAAGSFLCCLVVVAAIVGLLVWLPRRARDSIGSAIDRAADDPSGDFLVLDGSTTGLNARSSQATRAQLRVGSEYVAVARMSALGPKISVEVFQPDEILAVQEGDLERTGMDGFFANKNARTNIGQVLGWSADAPGILLQTVRGDLAFIVRPKNRGEVRQAYLAIGALISRPDAQ
jgi:hypothetical protein